MARLDSTVDCWDVCGWEAGCKRFPGCKPAVHIAPSTSDYTAQEYASMRAKLTAVNKRQAARRSTVDAPRVRFTTRGG